MKCVMAIELKLFLHNFLNLFKFKMAVIIIITAIFCLKSERIEELIKNSSYEY